MTSETGNAAVSPAPHWRRTLVLLGAGLGEVLVRRPRGSHSP